jgi:hypothetical protein
VDQACDHGLTAGIAIEAPDRAPVELHLGGTELDHVPQTGEARAGIIDRHLNLSVQLRPAVRSCSPIP